MGVLNMRLRVRDQLVRRLDEVLVRGLEGLTCRAIGGAELAAAARSARLLIAARAPELVT
jgi:hypothetical protein